MTEGHKTTINDLQERQLISDLFFSWLVVLFFIFASLLSREVSIIDSLSLCLFITIDVISGALFWILISKKSTFNVFELFGTGIALGTSICTILQQIFRNSIFDGVSPFLFFGATLFVFKKYQKNKQSIEITQVKSLRPIFLVCTLASLALCSENYVNWVTVLILAIGFLVIPKKLQVNSRIALVTIAIFVSVAHFARKILESVLFGFSNVTSRVSNFDQVFFEANSRGIENYGPFDNIFLSNTKFAYYWFSDAWSGSFSAKAGANEWVVTTEFGILVAALGAFFLAKAVCVNRHYSSIQSSAALILLATASLQGNANYAFSSQSFSLFISVLWIILIIFLINENAIHPTSANLVTLMFSIWILVLTKTVISVPFLLGIVVLMLASLARRLRFDAFIYMMTLVGSLIVYFVFIRPEALLRGSYSQIEFNLTTIIFEYFTINPWLDFILFLIFELIGVLWLLRQRNVLKDNFLSGNSIFLVFSFVSSLFIFFTNTSANQYLVVPLLLISPFLFSEGISRFHTWLLSFRKIVFGVAIGICAGFFSTAGLNHLAEKKSITPLGVTIFRLIPIWATIIFVSLILFQTFFNKQRRKLFQYCIMVLVAAAPGSYIAHTIKPLQQVILSKDYFEKKDSSLQIKMAQIQPSMQSVSSLATYSDVIASNSLDDFGLIAAMTGVRNFASTYTRQLWGNTEIRYQNQTSFGTDPNSNNYEVLRDGCVTLFFHDKFVSEINRTTLEPYATIMFEDEFGAVLKLSEGYSIPEEC